MKLVTHLKIQSSHLALVVALVIGLAFTDRLHAQAAPAPVSENPVASSLVMPVSLGEPAMSL